MFVRIPLLCQTFLGQYLIYPSNSAERLVSLCSIIMEKITCSRLISRGTWVWQDSLLQRTPCAFHSMLSNYKVLHLTLLAFISSLHTFPKENTPNQLWEHQWINIHPSVCTGFVEVHCPHSNLEGHHWPLFPTVLPQPPWLLISISLGATSWVLSCPVGDPPAVAPVAGTLLWLGSCYLIPHSPSCPQDLELWPGIQSGWAPVTATECILRDHRS